MRAPIFARAEELEDACSRLPPLDHRDLDRSNASLQFYTLGDWGVRGTPQGSDDQMRVATTMGCVARAAPPAFIATLGDNFYPVGVRGVKVGMCTRP